MAIPPVDCCELGPAPALGVADRHVLVLHFLSTLVVVHDRFAQQIAHRNDAHDPVAVDDGKVANAMAVHEVHSRTRWASVTVTTSRVIRSPTRASSRVRMDQLADVYPLGDHPASFSPSRTTRKPTCFSAMAASSVPCVGPAIECAVRLGRICARSGREQFLRES